MAQIKYVVFACLILLVGFVTINFIKTISSSLMQESPGENVFPIREVSIPVSDDVAKGQQLFKENCGSCHALDKVFSGPSLRAVMTRGPWAENKENFKKWVKNPTAFIPTTQYTIDLQKQYQVIMPSFTLSDEQLESLYQFLNNPPSIPQRIAAR